MEEKICIGKIVNTHGLKGEVRIESYSDFDEERYQKGNTVYIKTEEKYLPVKTATYRVHKGYPLVSFQDYQDINRIEKYKNCLVYIDAAARRPLPKGEYYRDQLIGLTAVDEEENYIGKVVSVEETAGAQNNLRVERKGKNDILIPYISEFVHSVDLANQKITIHVEEGLL